MTEPTTLREKFEAACYDSVDGHGAIDQDMGQFIDAICTALEDTGSPAHMRVAAELRGD